jgi:transposase-like protein
MPGPQTIIRYSQAFKRKVVEEIESGKYRIGEVRRIYDIRGAETVNRWLEQLGRGHLLNKVIRVEMKDEKDKLKELERQKRELESALAQAHLKILSLETMIDIAEDQLGIKIKKKSDKPVSKK